MQEVRDRVAEMVAELLSLLPGMDYQTLMNMYWDELSFWHEKAVAVYKKLHGVS